MREQANIEALYGPDRDAYLSTLPLPKPGEPLFWGAYPSDELAYESFIRWILAFATAQPAPGHPQNHGPIHSSDHKPGNQEVYRSAIVDWVHPSEDAPTLQGLVPGGWIDPDCLNIGGVSRVRDDTEITLLTSPATVYLEHRAFSFVTLEAPTWIEGCSEQRRSLVFRLIQPLVRLGGTQHDNLYGWLDLIFTFCRGKPVVYYSRYTPSERVYAIAQAANVQLTYLPLRQLPEALLASNAAYRSMQLSVSQWRALEDRMAQAGLSQEVDVLRAHRLGSFPDGEVDSRTTE